MPVTLKEVYGSTHIDAAGYDPETKTLTVRFMGGEQYSYHGVPENVWREFESSTSKGRMVGIVLRRGYECTKDS